MGIVNCTLRIKSKKTRESQVDSSANKKLPNKDASIHVKNVQEGSHNNQPPAHNENSKPKEIARKISPDIPDIGAMESSPETLVRPVNAGVVKTNSQTSMWPYGEPSLAALMWNMFSDRRIGNLYKFEDSFDDLFQFQRQSFTVSRPKTDIAMNYTPSYDTTRDIVTRTYAQKPFVCPEGAKCTQRLNELIKQQESLENVINIKCEMNVRLLNENKNLKNELNESRESIKTLEAEKELIRQYWTQRYQEETCMLIKRFHTTIEQANENVFDFNKALVKKLEDNNSFLINTNNSTLNDLHAAYQKNEVLRNLLNHMRTKFESYQMLVTEIKRKDKIIRQQGRAIKRLTENRRPKARNCNRCYLSGKCFHHSKKH